MARPKPKIGEVWVARHRVGKEHILFRGATEGDYWSTNRRVQSGDKVVIVKIPTEQDDSNPLTYTRPPHGDIICSLWGKLYSIVPRWFEIHFRPAPT